jgi:hypothetical protein
VSEADIEIDIKEWDGLFALISSNLKRAQKILKVAVQAFAFQDIIEHFRNEEGPDGKWSPRSPATQHRYAMINSGQWRPPKGMKAGSFNPSNKLLQLTGFLRQSIIPTNIKNEGNDGVRLFATAKYSGRHNDGTGGMPKRSFMWASESAQEKMVNMIAQMVMEESGAV